MAESTVREVDLFFEGFRAHAGRVVTQLQLALDALQARSPDLAQRVITSDDTFDAAELAFEAEIIDVLSRGNPTREELRRLVTCTRINTYFERIADHAVNLARLTVKLHLLTDDSVPDELSSMCERVGVAAERTLEAFNTQDVAIAESIAIEDVYLDRLDKALQARTEDLATHNGGTIHMAFILYRCGRELERIGDILAEWAETTVFMATGQEIRHCKWHAIVRPR